MPVFIVALSYAQAKDWAKQFLSRPSYFYYIGQQSDLERMRGVVNPDVLYLAGSERMIDYHTIRQFILTRQR
jgi:hypothetical protein